MPKKVLCVLVVLSGLTGCMTSTYYPYNNNSVVYYTEDPIEETLVVIPARRYYQFDHQTQDYYHSTPLQR